jgi:hypothetical protein
MRYFVDQSCLPSYKNACAVGYKVEIKSNFTSYFISSPILVLINFSPSNLGLQIIG